MLHYPVNNIQLKPFIHPSILLCIHSQWREGRRKEKNRVCRILIPSSKERDKSQNPQSVAVLCVCGCLVSIEKSVDLQYYYPKDLNPVQRRRKTNRKVEQNSSRRREFPIEGPAEWLGGDGGTPELNTLQSTSSRYYYSHLQLTIDFSGYFKILQLLSSTSSFVCWAREMRRRMWSSQQWLGSNTLCLSFEYWSERIIRGEEERKV